MTFFEDIETQLINLAIALISAVIIYFAWRSTDVSNDALPPTALLIISNDVRRNINAEGVNIVRSSSSLSNHSNATEELELENDRSPSPTPDDTQITETNEIEGLLDELTTIGSATHRTTLGEIHYPLENESESGPQHIIQDMDNTDTAAGLRRRRDYENNQRIQAQGESATSIPNEINESNQQESLPRIRRENLNIQTVTDTDRSHAENCSNENNENESKSQIEISKTVVKDDDETTTNERKEDEFRIKLKYLNDELKLVTGSPNEAIGDFKKRNFTMELSAQKIIRLVFNGHVLQPDSKTLQACGLFDNCVVHCLVHSKKNTTPSYSNENRSNVNQGTPNTAHAGLGTNNFSERTGNGVLLLYLGMIFLSLAIIFTWYCRIQYSYLFSWYSTSGLVLMTALHLLTFPIILLMEQDVPN